MKDEYIVEMLNALIKAGLVKDAMLTRQVLEECWKDKVAITWTVNDVYQAIAEHKFPHVPEDEWSNFISEENAIAVLKRAHSDHNAEYGICSAYLRDAARELGFIE
jgi:hypothetical protein